MKILLLLKQKKIEKNYGQADLVRLYGSDIVDRIEKMGFVLNLYICEETMDKEEIKRLGFIERDSVLLCKK